MRITFVLPNPIRIPMGGAKVVYTHAEGLASLGHDVHVVAPRRVGRGVAARVRERAVALRDTMHGVAGESAYGGPGVQTVELERPDPNAFPDADVVVATGVQTVEWVRALPPAKGTALYFVQGDETFVRPDARESWQVGIPIVTCAQWLAQEMRSHGVEPLAVLPNAIDPREFGLDSSIAGRAPRIIALYHRHPVKGPDVLIEALAEIRRQVPEVEADVFSARPPSHLLPSWVQVYVRPPHLRSLYNRAAVVLHTSRSESWGLVPMEGAACGAAVVASANRGVQEYLRDGVSMRTGPVGDGLALGRLAVELLEEGEQRVRLAEAAVKAVGRYSWSDSTARLDAVVRGLKA